MSPCPASRPTRTRTRVRAIALLLLAAASAGRGTDAAAADAARVSPVESVAADARVEAWRELIRRAPALEADRLAAVNRFFNGLRQQDDRITWGVADYWATPLELLRAGAGDCEDFAIGKYLTLLEMGVPRERLRLAVARTRSRAGRIEAHLVLIYREGPGTPEWVLDNLTPRIAAVEHRTDLALLAPEAQARLLGALARRTGAAATLPGPVAVR